jgi:predicted GIY-YIG superfamily endonuclease
MFSHLSFLSPIEKQTTVYTDLHLASNLNAAREALTNHCGVYAIINVLSGALYVGSSQDLSFRMTQHLCYGITNEHLQYAIRAYGLDNFIFVVLAFCEQAIPSEWTEQHYLVWLFSLSPELRYNFARNAGAPITGRFHSQETKAVISASHFKVFGQVRNIRCLVIPARRKLVLKLVPQYLML